MDAYLGEVNGVVVSLAGIVPADDLDHVQHLIDHGEPAEGLLSLAWFIANRDLRVPSATLRSVRRLAGDLVPDQAWPANLERYSSD
jgi:hypothetical protein